MSDDEHRRGRLRKLTEAHGGDAAELLSGFDVCPRFVARERGQRDGQVWLSLHPEPHAALRYLADETGEWWPEAVHDLDGDEWRDGVGLKVAVTVEMLDENMPVRASTTEPPYLVAREGGEDAGRSE